MDKLRTTFFSFIPPLLDSLILTLFLCSFILVSVEFSFFSFLDLHIVFFFMWFNWNKTYTYIFNIFIEMQRVTSVENQLERESKEFSMRKSATIVDKSHLFGFDWQIVDFHPIDKSICEEKEEEIVHEMSHTSLSCERSSSPILTNEQVEEIDEIDEVEEEVLPVLVSNKHDKSTSMESIIIMTKNNTNDQSNRFVFFEKNRSVEETPSNRLRQQQDRLLHSHTFYPHPCRQSKKKNSFQCSLAVHTGKWWTLFTVMMMMIDHI